MPSGRQRARSEINYAEPNHVLDGRVSSGKMKVVQIQLVAAERNRDGTLEMVTTGVALRELADVLPAKPRLRVPLGPQGVAVSDSAEPMLAIALALGQAGLGDIEVRDSESGLKRYLRGIENTRSPKAEGESLRDVDE
jgi:hypothetical protein